MLSCVVEFYMETSFLFSQQQLLPGRKVQLVKCMPYVGFNEKYLVDVDSASLSLVFVCVSMRLLLQWESTNTSTGTLCLS